MNDDDLEKKLHELTGTLRRPDPTPAWKTDILARARREAAVTPIRQTVPPRWLMLGWAAAWMAILAMNLSAPKDTAADVALKWTAAPPNAAPPQSDLVVLITFHRQQSLNLDLPQ